ncbi:MAG: HAD hydrolase-like protein [Anaerolineaceae bacterium]|nr:HAD hydrolase-like protein [Anaerolineaceae bacterium]
MAETPKFNHFELINPFDCGNFKFALFDFDGTISLIREGWQQIMLPMMIELLMQTPHHDSEKEIKQITKQFVAELTGKQTIYQMIRLSEEISKRGGTPLDPLAYKNEYHDRLLERIKNRIEDLEQKKVTPESLSVPGSIKFIQQLHAHGIKCFLASGTDEKYVLHEAELLGLPPYFEGIFGAQDDYKNFSKKKVITQIIQTYHLSGNEFISFGDGYVEIENTKSVSGVAVGVATNEAQRSGIDEWKRSRLIAAGADLIIPDFHETDSLVNYFVNKRL